MMPRTCCIGVLYQNLPIHIWGHARSRWPKPSSKLKQASNPRMDRSSYKCSMRLSTPTCRSGSSLALQWLSAWRSCCLEGVPSPNLSRFGIVLAEKVRHQRRAQPVWRVKIAPNIRDRLFHKSILLVRLQALHQGLRPLLEMLGQHVQIVVVLRFRPL